MAEPHPANEMHHRKDSSNLQYAGMYLTFVATLLFLLIFLLHLLMNILQLRRKHLRQLNALKTYPILFPGMIQIGLLLFRVVSFLI